jgi:hypothetical protein
MKQMCLSGEYGSKDLAILHLKVDSLLQEWSSLMVIVLFSLSDSVDYPMSPPKLLIERYGSA